MHVSYLVNSDVIQLQYDTKDMGINADSIIDQKVFN